MKTIKKALINHMFVEHMPEPENMQQGMLYISKKHNTAIHLCLCGCGEQTVTPLDQIVTENEKIVAEAHKSGWILTEKGGRISLTPSIGNYSFPCKSHYIITNDTANFV